MFNQGRDSGTGGGQPSSVTNANRPSKEPSVIDADLKVMGDLISGGDIHVKGSVKGDIKSRSVTICEGAQVEGAVNAETVRVSGRITGQIEAPSVTIEKSAEVLGDVIHQTLSIEAGALLEGNCRRLASAPAAAAPKAAPEAEKFSALKSGSEAGGPGEDKPLGSSDKSLAG